MNIAGYIIKERIGVGGQATVYEALQESLQRRVALKVLNPVLATDPEFTERFLNEARILANLDHSNAITIHDFGVSEGLHYLSMELVEGGSLRQLIRRGLDPDTVLDYVAIIADVLSRAHAMKIVHRDIKPGNVLFRRDGSLVLTDFGIAKRLDSGNDLTITGTTLGSPGYLSPEQAQNLPVDGRADIYSLGAMTFEMLTGNRPYVAESDFMTINRHVNDPVPVLPDAFASFQPLIQRMMAKAPEDRFDDADALVAFLRELRPEIPVRARSSHEAAAASPGEDRTTQMNMHLSEPPARRPGWMAAAAVILSVAGGLWFLAREPQPALQPPMASTPGPVNLDGSGPLSLAGAGGSAADAAPAPPAVEPEPPARLAAVVPPEVTAAGRETENAADLDPVLPAAPSGVAGPDRDTGVAPAGPDRVIPRAADRARSAEELAGAARVGELLGRARGAMDDLRLTVPENDNALYYYDQVLAIDPEHEEAGRARQTIAGRYAELARRAKAQGDRRRARTLYERGLAVDGAHPELLALAGELERPRSRVASRGADTTTADGIRGETPRQLYRRIKGWFD